MKVVMDEFRRGHTVCEEILKEKRPWDDLFEDMDFFAKYKDYLQVIIGAENAADARKWWVRADCPSVGGPILSC